MPDAPERRRRNGSLRASRALAFALALAALAGESCRGGGDGGGWGDGGGEGNGGAAATPIPFEQLCDRYIEDVCAALVRCVPAARFRTVADCRAQQECFGARQLKGEVDAGWVVYRPEGAGRCHAIVNADPCGFADSFAAVPAVGEVLGRCPGALEGRRKQGEVCIARYNCLAGLFCAKKAGSCEGTCQPWRPIGQDCDENERLCDPSSAACIEGTCRRRPTREGDPCWSGTDCPGAALWCEEAAGLCRRRPGAGAPCGPATAPCAEGLLCAQPSGQAATCGPKRGAGETCRYPSDVCQPGLSCVPLNTRLEGECRPHGSMGASCGSAREPVCDPGLVCGSTGSCYLYARKGEACSHDGACAMGLRCGGGTCTDESSLGKPCELGVRCGAGRCLAGVCEPKLSLGEPCTAGDDCRSGRCQGSTCIDPSLCSGR